MNSFGKAMPRLAKRCMNTCIQTVVWALALWSTYVGQPALAVLNQVTTIIQTTGVVPNSSSHALDRDR